MNTSQNPTYYHRRVRDNQMKPKGGRILSKTSVIAMDIPHRPMSSAMKDGHMGTHSLVFITSAFPTGFPFPFLTANIPHLPEVDHHGYRRHEAKVFHRIPDPLRVGDTWPDIKPQGQTSNVMKGRVYSLLGGLP